MLRLELDGIGQAQPHQIWHCEASLTLCKLVLANGQPRKKEKKIKYLIILVIVHTK